MSIKNRAKKSPCHFWQGQNFIMKNLTNLFWDYFFLASWNFLYLLLNLSTRPAVSTSFILPV